MPSPHNITAGAKYVSMQVHEMTKMKLTDLTVKDVKVAAKRACGHLGIATRKVHAVTSTCVT